MINTKQGFPFLCLLLCFSLCWFNIPVEAGLAVTESFQDIIIQDNFAYATSTHLFMILDVSSQVAITEISSVTSEDLGFENNYSPREFSVRNNIAYIILHDPSYKQINDQMVSLDITNRSNPIKLDSIELTHNCEKIFIEGDLAYITGQYLQIVNISESGSMDLLSTYQIGHCYDVYVNSNYAYIVVEEGVKIIDVSDPHHPSPLGLMNLDIYISGIVVQEDIIYVVGRGTSWSALQLIDCSNNSNLILIESFETKGNPQDIALSDNYAFIPYWGFEAGGMQIINILNSSHLFLTGEFHVSESLITEAIALYEDRAYMSCERDGIYVLDISNKSTPLLLEIFTKSFYVPSNTYALIWNIIGITIILIIFGLIFSSIKIKKPRFLADQMDRTRKKANILAILSGILGTFLTIFIIDLSFILNNSSLYELFLFLFTLGLPYIFTLGLPFGIFVGLFAHKKDLVKILAIGSLLFIPLVIIPFFDFTGALPFTPLLCLAAIPLVFIGGFIGYNITKRKWKDEGGLFFQ